MNTKISNLRQSLWEDKSSQSLHFKLCRIEGTQHFVFVFFSGLCKLASSSDFVFVTAWTSQFFNLKRNNHQSVQNNSQFTDSILVLLIALRFHLGCNKTSCSLNIIVCLFCITAEPNPCFGVLIWCQLSLSRSLGFFSSYKLTSQSSSLDLFSPGYSEHFKKW